MSNSRASSSTTKGAARAVADLAQGTILAVVEIDAPPERVFRAITDPKEIVQWWGSPEAYRTESWESDLRPGGQWRAAGRGSDGAGFTVTGEFVEVDPPRKLVTTWSPQWDPGQRTTVTWRLEATASGTRVTLRHEGFAGRPAVCEQHTSGWELVLGWMANFASPAAAPAAAPAASKYFVCRLNPPRKTFPADITPAELAVMQQHGAYWRGLLNDGLAVVFGPVADPAGAWGLGVVVAASADEVRALNAKDPVITSGMGFSIDVLPMMSAIVRG